MGGCFAAWGIGEGLNSRWFSSWSWSFGLCNIVFYSATAGVTREIVLRVDLYMRLGEMVSVGCQPFRHLLRFEELTALMVAVINSQQYGCLLSF